MTFRFLPCRDSIHGYVTQFNGQEYKNSANPSGPMGRASAGIGLENSLGAQTSGYSGAMGRGGGGGSRMKRKSTSSESDNESLLLLTPLDFTDSSISGTDVSISGSE
jgi:hypothetical protein